MKKIILFFVFLLFIAGCSGIKTGNSFSSAKEITGILDIVHVDYPNDSSESYYSVYDENANKAYRINQEDIAQGQLVPGSKVTVSINQERSIFKNIKNILKTGKAISYTPKIVISVIQAPETVQSVDQSQLKLLLIPVSYTYYGEGSMLTCNREYIQNILEKIKKIVYNNSYGRISVTGNVTPVVFSSLAGGSGFVEDENFREALKFAKDLGYNPEDYNSIGIIGGGGPGGGLSGLSGGNFKVFDCKIESTYWHELSHAYFGLSHAGSISDTGNFEEYGEWEDTMGSGMYREYTNSVEKYSVLTDARNENAWEKPRPRFFSSEEVALNPPDGVYKIKSLEDASYPGSYLTIMKRYSNINYTCSTSGCFSGNVNDYLSISYRTRTRMPGLGGHMYIRPEHNMTVNFHIRNSEFFDGDGPVASIPPTVFSKSVFLKDKIGKPGFIYTDTLNNISAEVMNISPEYALIKLGNPQPCSTEGQIRSCALSQGVCAGVSEICIRGYWSGCYYGYYYQHDETYCDGKDNDCDGSIDEENVCSACVDYDGDSFVVRSENCTVSNIDCNDKNANINPNASEVCFDMIDNNCNGIKDENCGQFRTLCTSTDMDGDGYSTAGGSCGPKDCNDSLQSINPGTVEVCDGIDNECDNSTDEQNSVGCSIYYWDNDGDGYGKNNNISLFSGCFCTAWNKFTSTNHDDCNDDNASINPGFGNCAPIICGNNICETGETCSSCPADCRCDDGLFCNGIETCNGASCQQGTDPCNDLDACTTDSCNETSDSCNHRYNCSTGGSVTFIRANNVTGVVIANKTKNVKVESKLIVNSSLKDKPADWFLLAKMNGVSYYYNPTSQWTKGTRYTYTNKPLTNITNWTTIFNAKLPNGTTNFSFIVDTKPNKAIDANAFVAVVSVIVK